MKTIQRMKRLLALAAALLLCLSAAACSRENTTGDDGTASVARNTRVQQFGRQGILEGCDVTLGMSVQAVKDLYHYDDEEYWMQSEAPSEGTDSDGADSEGLASAPIDPDGHDSEEMLVITGEDPVRMDAGTARYYYRAAREEDGIAFIAMFGDAYGFQVGYTSVDELRSAVGEPTAEGPSTVEEQFFFPSPLPDAYTVTYAFDPYVVSFYFYDGLYYAAVIYDQTVWTPVQPEPAESAAGSEGASSGESAPESLANEA